MFLGNKEQGAEMQTPSACLGVLKITPLFPGGMCPATARVRWQPGEGRLAFLFTWELPAIFYRA